MSHSVDLQIDRGSLLTKSHPSVNSTPKARKKDLKRDYQPSDQPDPGFSIFYGVYFYVIIFESLLYWLYSFEEGYVQSNK